VLVVFVVVIRVTFRHRGRELLTSVGEKFRLELRRNVCGKKRVVATGLDPEVERRLTGGLEIDAVQRLGGGLDSVPVGDDSVCLLGFEQFRRRFPRVEEVVVTASLRWNEREAHVGIRPLVIRIGVSSRVEFVHPSPLPRWVVVFVSVVVGPPVQTAAE